MTFRVYDNNKPADCFHHKVHESWNKSEFETLQDATEYAFLWLGVFAPPNDYEFKPNVPYPYSGYGDELVIREVTKV